MLLFIVFELYREPLLGSGRIVPVVIFVAFHDACKEQDHDEDSSEWSEGVECEEASIFLIVVSHGQLVLQKYIIQLSFHNPFFFCVKEMLGRRAASGKERKSGGRIICDIRPAREKVGLVFRDVVLPLRNSTLARPGPGSPRGWRTKVVAGFRHPGKPICGSWVVVRELAGRASPGKCERMEGKRKGKKK